MAKEHYDRKVFYAEARPIFGSLQQENVDGINMILDAWEPTPFKDRRCLSTILANVKAETGDMLPKDEYGGSSKSYGQPNPKTGKRYFGRGQIQLTHLSNYERATKEINSRNLIGRQVDLVNNPEQAKAPDVSPVVAIYGMEEGWFTGKKLSDYFNSTTNDWKHSRRIVNSLDRADEIAANAQRFYSALTKAATVDEPEQPETPEEIPENPTVALLKEQIRAATGVQKVTVILE